MKLTHRSCLVFAWEMKDRNCRELAWELKRACPLAACMGNSMQFGEARLEGGVQ